MKRSPRTNSARVIRAAAAGATQKSKALNLFADFSIEAAAAAADGQKPKPRKFSMTAYNGGAMQLAGFYSAVVVDLSGLEGLDKTRPILKNHDTEQLVGHTTKVSVKGKSLSVEGVVSGAGDAAREVLAAHDNGFPWQASIGAKALSMEYVREGVKATANGQEFTGPINIARKTVLGEISFVPLGADDSTSARIAAKSAKETSMNFEQWLEAKGFALADLSDAQKASLKAAFDAEQLLAAADPNDAGNDKGKKKPGGAKSKKKLAAAVAATIAAADGGDDDDDDDSDEHADPILGMRAAAAAESKRISAIRKACGGKHEEIEAKAIAEGWSSKKVELEVLRAERPKAPGAIVRDSQLTPATIEAAIVLSGGMHEVPVIQGRSIETRSIDKVYDAKTLEAADRRFRRRIGLQEVLIEAACANGYTGGAFSIKSDLAGVLRAAFSTMSLSGILSNVANKFLLDGFMNVEGVWRMIASRRPVNDFKTVTSYRLTGDAQFEKVGPTGELKHGKLDEESFTNKAETYGKMFGITRQDIINDDLGALIVVPRKIGRGSGLKLNDVFWTEYLDNASFFATGNNNYFTGASTNLQSSSLKTAVSTFRKQVDADGKPLGATPTTLLVPPEEEITAQELFVSTNLQSGNTGKQPDRNVFAGKYQPQVSAYLSNSSYTGYSTTAWYLLCDPNDISVIEVAFLNGVEQPTVETADADFNVLGIQVRGYFDFGVSKQDSRGGVKSKGAA